MPRKPRFETQAQMIERLSPYIPDGPLHAIRVQAKLIDHAHGEFQQAVAFIGDDELTAEGITYRLNAIHAALCALRSVMYGMDNQITVERASVVELRRVAK